MFYHKSDFPNFKQRSSKVAWVYMPALQLGYDLLLFRKRKPLLLLLLLLVSTVYKH